MDAVEAQFVTVDTAGPSRRIAVLPRAGAGAGLVWLGGFKSDMIGTKATMLDELAAEHGRPMLRFDYSGHGMSEGDFARGTIGAWLAESLAVYREYARGEQVLVGSSMGGWIALLLARALMREPGAAPIRAMVLIAPAPDMTERLMWDEMSTAQRDALARDGHVMRESDYGFDPYPITRGLIEEGRAHLMLDGAIAAPFPVRILHGMEDPDVPWRLSAELVSRLDGPDVALTLVKDGDHRLSTPRDLALLRRAAAEAAGMS